MVKEEKEMNKKEEKKLIKAEDTKIGKIVSCTVFYILLILFAFAIHQKSLIGQNMICLCF